MEIRHWGRDLFIKETYFLRVFVSMHSLFPTGHEPSYVMLRKTTSEEYLEFCRMIQRCCSRFQPLSFRSFQLQGRMGYSNIIQCSGNELSSLEECWPNTEADGLTKLIAMSRLSLRCFGFWFGGASGLQGCGWLKHNTLGEIFFSFCRLDLAWAPLACHGLVPHLFEGSRGSRHGVPNKNWVPTELEH